jgi:uncharacterized protein with von Willebrand factor type A (vWA) domain
VDTRLVLEQVVDRLLADVEARFPGEVPDAVAAAGDIARRGYLWRLAEVSAFSAARGDVPRILARLQAGESVESLARELAEAEPLARPAPDDEGATTWHVPGPGGHVRHYGSLASIEAAGLADGALKREWLYGFFVRCCEESLD